MQGALTKAVTTLLGALQSEQRTVSWPREKALDLGRGCLLVWQGPWLPSHPGQPHKEGLTVSAWVSAPSLPPPHAHLPCQPHKPLP